MELVISRGLAVFRWGAWTWMAMVLLINRNNENMARLWLGIVLVGAALVVTTVQTALLKRDKSPAMRRSLVIIELAVGATIMTCDGLVYESGHAFSTSQSLGSQWPLVGVMNAGVFAGPWWAAGGGLLLGMCRFASVVINGYALGDIGGSQVLSLFNTVVFSALTGIAVAYVTQLMRRAEREISAAKAREEIARTLHDGVLQTLAVVERRADDPALAKLAREQERELREFLFGPLLDRKTDLGAALRAAAARYEDTFDGRVQVIVAEDLPPVKGDGIHALSGAVGEALTNAGKHGRARNVTVYVEPNEDGGLFCSVKDDGIGFDVQTTSEGVGLQRSIRGRMHDIGGKAEIRSRSGEGAEVTLWVP